MIAVARVAPEQDTITVRRCLILLVLVYVVIHVPLVCWQEIDLGLDVPWVLRRTIDVVDIATPL